MSIFSEAQHPGGGSGEKAQAWVGLPAEKAAPGMQGAGMRIINCLLSSQDPRCSLGGLSFPRRQVLENNLTVTWGKVNIFFIFSFLFWFYFCQGAGVGLGEMEQAAEGLRNSSKPTGLKQLSGLMFWTSIILFYLFIFCPSQLAQLLLGSFWIMGDDYFFSFLACAHH